MATVVHTKLIKTWFSPQIRKRLKKDTVK